MIRFISRRIKEERKGGNKKRNEGGEMKGRKEGDTIDSWPGE